MNANQVLGLAAGASLTTAFVVGFVVGEKRANTKFDQLMEEEIAEAKQFFARLYKKEDFETPEQAAETLGVSPLVEPAAEAVKSYGGHVIQSIGVQDAGPNARGMGPVEPITIDELTEVSEEDGVIEQNVFDGTTIEQLDIDGRQPNVPYVISTEEFMENEPGHNQISVTYYEGDNILADERDDIIEDVNETIGRLNLGLFGLASGDPNIVHIRNELRHLDFEMMKSTGEYRREVAGFTDEGLQHSDDGRMRRRQRRWDE